MKNESTARAFALGFSAARDGLPPRPAQCHEFNEMIRGALDGADMRRMLSAFVRGHKAALQPQPIRPHPVAMPRESAWLDAWPVFVGAGSIFFAIGAVWLIGP